MNKDAIQRYAAHTALWSMLAIGAVITPPWAIIDVTLIIAAMKLNYWLEANERE